MTVNTNAFQILSSCFPDLVDFMRSDPKFRGISSLYKALSDERFSTKLGADKIYHIVMDCAAVKNVETFAELFVQHPPSDYGSLLSIAREACKSGCLEIVRLVMESLGKKKIDSAYFATELLREGRCVYYEHFDIFCFLMTFLSGKSLEIQAKRALYTSSKISKNWNFAEKLIKKFEHHLGMEKILEASVACERVFDSDRFNFENRAFRKAVVKVLFTEHSVNLMHKYEMICRFPGENERFKLFLILKISEFVLNDQF